VRRTFALRPNIAFALLLGCALLLRALVPTGWMPMANDGTLRLVLCSGRQIVVEHPLAGHHGAGKEERTTSHADQPCAFAGLALPWIGADSRVDLPVIALGAIAAAPVFLVAIGRGLAAPPPPATGPPLLS